MYVLYIPKEEISIMGGEFSSVELEVLVLVVDFLGVVLGDSNTHSSLINTNPEDLNKANMAPISIAVSTISSSEYFEKI
jgi:hypothetical protein